MKTKETKEEQTPVRCVCKGEAVFVQLRGKKMFSCPNPELCKCNIRTQWHTRKENAIAEWNTLVDSFVHTRR